MFWYYEFKRRTLSSSEWTQLINGCLEVIIAQDFKRYLTTTLNWQTACFRRSAICNFIRHNKWHLNHVLLIHALCTPPMEPINKNCIPAIAGKIKSHLCFVLHASVQPNSKQITLSSPEIYYHFGRRSLIKSENNKSLIPIHSHTLRMMMTYRRKLTTKLKRKKETQKLYLCDKKEIALIIKYYTFIWTRMAHYHCRKTI